MPQPGEPVDSVELDGHDEVKINSIKNVMWCYQVLDEAFRGIWRGRVIFYMSTLSTSVRMSQSRVTQLAESVSDRDHTQGTANAPVTLVKYGDYECSYCQEAFRAVKQLREDETLTEQVRFVFRNFPLTSVHPHAQQAAEAAEAAAAQGQFWEMHDMLYEHQNALELNDLQKYAERLGLDGEYLIQELEQGAFTERVHEDILSGARSGVNGTPTFFINGERYDEQWDADVLRAALEDAI